MSVECYKICSRLYMHTTSCVGQQLFIFIKTVAYLSTHECFILHLEITGRVKTKETFREVG